VADALRAKRRECLVRLDALLQSTFLALFGDPIENPMRWEQVHLSDLIADDDRINYGVVQPGDDFPSGKPLVRVGDFLGGELDLTDIKHIDPAIDARYERSRLIGTELLISCVGSIGTVCRVSSAAKGYNIARAVARVPLGKKVEREFMLFCLRSAGVQNYFASETRTVSQPTLNIGLIKAATVTLPPLDLQRRFAAIVESVEHQKALQRAHLAELNALFASLQDRAFNGDLRAA
jgi:type I restriction enzyme S subunit